MTKKTSSFLEEKSRVTPSVAAPGDINPSDATEIMIQQETHQEMR